MYHDFFGIAENPFSITPDPRYLYMSKGHQEALAHLLYGVREGGGFVLLTGEVGTGKTSVCRCLLEQLPEAVDAALILNPRLSEIELLASICDELGVAYPAKTRSLKVLVDLLNRHLLEVHAKGRHAVVIIDEAQNLSAGVLEQVRLLTNLETATRKLLQIVLIGQPELCSLLERDEMRQLVQRITARYHLMPLSRGETRAYITHRLEVGGLPPALFGPAVVGAIYRRARGVPRLINSLCDRCLLGAYVQNRKTISSGMVRQAAKEVLGGSGGPQGRSGAALPWVAASAVLAAALVILDPADLDLLSGVAEWQGDVESIILDRSEASSEGRIEVAEAEPEAPEQVGPLVADPAALAPVATDPAALEASQGSEVTAESAPSVGEDIGPARAPVDTEAVATMATIESTGFVESPEGLPAEPGGRLLLDAAAPPAEWPTAEAVEIEGEVPVEPDIALSAEPAPTETPAPGVAQTAAAGNGRPPGRDGAALPEGGASGATPDASVRTAGLPPPADELSADGLRVGELFTRSALPVDGGSAFAALLSLWGLAQDGVDGQFDCAASARLGVKCMVGEASWDTLVGFNRPVLITLKDTHGRRASVVLASVAGDRVALLAGKHRVVTERAALKPLWSGEYLMLWRPPAVYRRLLASGAQGRDVAWLKGRLAEIFGEPRAEVQEAVFDSALRDKVMAFQESRGLEADGIVGTRTLIHLNTVAKESGVPLLQPTAR